MRRVDAKADEFPWAVAFLTDVGGGHYVPVCGGALIHESWVLTAAHCGVSPRDRLVIGSADLGPANPRLTEIAEVVAHPTFDPKSLMSDVALVRLAQPATGIPVLGIDDGDGSVVLEGTATMIGWGSGVLGGTFSLKLRKLDVQLLSSAASGDSIFDGVLCVDPTNGSVGVSTGDSGGPLLVRDARSSRWRVVGLISDGARSAGAAPHVHAAGHGDPAPATMSSRSAPVEEIDHSWCDRYTLVGPFAEWIRGTLATKQTTPRVRARVTPRTPKPARRNERGL